MTALSIIIDIVLILISIVLIVAVLMQQGQRQGLGAISGGAETFFGKNKASSLEGRLQKITKIGVVVFVVLAICATIITAHTIASDKSATVEEAMDVIADALNEEAENEVEEAGEAIEEAAEEVVNDVEEAGEAVEEAAEEAVNDVEEAGEAVEEAAEETVSEEASDAGSEDAEG